MPMKKLTKKHVLAVLLATALPIVAIAAVNYFSIDAEVIVTESNLSVSPKSFSIEIPRGQSYTKKIAIENTGKEVEIYFEKVVEGPSPDKISISFHDAYGNSITSSKKLRVPTGSEAFPSKTFVNVHIDASKSAEKGIYKIYIQAKG